MASSFEIFNIAKKYLWDGTIDLDTDTIKLALVTSGYTKDLTDEIWSEVSGSEVTTGNGYTTGGETLASSDVTNVTTTTKWDATDVTWTTLTKTFRFGVLYAVGTLNGIVDPLIAIILFDTTPADIVVSAMNFTVSWNASGIATY
jgi:hypothetical protein